MCATCVLTVCSLTTSVRGDLRVREAARDAGARTSCSRGVSSASPGGGAAGRAARELGDEPARHGRGEDRRAVGDHPDRGEQLRLGRVLEQEPAGARAQRLVDHLVEVERGQHEHPRRRRVSACEPTRRLDAVDVGHADVHEHDVRPQLGRERDRSRAVAGLADHRRCRARRRGSCGSRRAPAPGRRRGARGSRACLVRQPRAHREAAARAAGPASSSPPTSATRSRMPTARGRRPRRCRVAAPAPSSRHLDLQRPPARTPRARRRARRPGVLERVRERLLDDAVGRQVDARRQLDALAVDARPRPAGPAARTCSASASSRASEGCGERASCSSSWRSRPSRRRISPSACSPVRSIASNACRDCSGEPARSCARPPRACTHDHGDRVRHDVVQLAGDAGPLLGDGRARLLVALALELQGTRAQPPLALAAQPDQQPGEPRAADDERAERDVAGLERISVIGHEGGDGRSERRPRRPTPAARVRSRRARRARRRTAGRR